MKILESVFEFGFKLLHMLLQALYFLMIIIPTIIGIGLIVIMTWLLGNFITAITGLNIVLSYIITFTFFTLAILSMLTNKNSSGNYSPAAYFFLGWLLGRK